MRIGSICFLSLMTLIACGVKKDKNNDNKESQTDDLGSDVESVGEKISTDSAQSGITILMADTPLPDCTDKNRGQTFYVTAESLFRFCDSSGAWTVIDLKGAKGDTGNTGLPSTPGANWAMYSGTSKMGKTFNNPLDIGLTSLQGTGADNIFTQLELRTFLLVTLQELTTDSRATRLYCNYFLTNDCSGICYSVQPVQLAQDIFAPKIVAEKWENYSVPNRSSLYMFDFNQITSLSFNSQQNLLSGSSCIDLSSSPQTYMAVGGYPYSLPNGIAYPLTNINFKAE